jgi:hypothetical protein
MSVRIGPGDLAAARARYAAALGLGRARGARSFLDPVTRALRSLAGPGVAAGDPRRAVRICCCSRGPACWR